MTLGEVLQTAVSKDLAHGGKKGMVYTEFINNGKFECKLSSSLYPEASIECSAPDDGTEETKNYARAYFLSMVFNAAIYGTKRMNYKKNKKK